MLIALREYIRKMETVTVLQLAHHFDRDQETVRHMLCHWQDKGVVAAVHGCGPCHGSGGCGGCQLPGTERYQWCGPPLE